MTVQLRTYQLAGDGIEDWLAWWRTDAVAVRERHGIRVLFGLFDASRVPKATTTRLRPLGPDGHAD